MDSLLVAVWAVGTQSLSWTERDLNARCVELKNALDQTKTALDRQPRGSVGVLVAPEYMFSLEEEQRPESSRFQLNAAAALTLKSRLAELTRGAFENILLIPGSIAFSKEVEPTGSVSKQRTGKMYRALLKHEAVLNAGTVAPPGLERELRDHRAKMVRFREWTRSSKKGRRQLRIARNCAYGYWRGNKVFACRKRTELGEIFEGDDTFYINAGESTRWQHEGVSFGVEICKDAADGYLKLVDGAEVDIQIVISASLAMRDIKVCARKYVIHAAQQPDEARVIHATQGWMDPVSTVTVAGFPLRFYLADVRSG